MINWQYFSLGYQQQDAFFPKFNLDISDMSRDQKVSMMKIGSLVANLLCLDK